MKKVIVDGQARLPAFSHATVVDNVIYVSGTLGTAPGTMELVDGGMGPQTAQTIANMRAVLRECGADLDDVAKVNVYVSTMDHFPEMNEAYIEAFGDTPPARITVGGVDLALGALVEMDCVAHTA